MAAIRMKKRSKPARVQGDNGTALDYGQNSIHRKSVARTMSRKIELPKNLGVTEALEDLQKPSSIMKGIFGLNDLSSLDNRGPSGSFSMGINGNVAAKQVVQPVFPFKQLCQLYLTSTTLRECVQAYVRNIESYGQRIVYVGPEGKKESRQATAELSRIENVLGGLMIDGESLTEARENSRIDKESMGARAFEVVEDMMGRVTGIKRIPTNTVLLTRLDKEPTTALVYNPTTQKYHTQQRRFRRYVQRDEDGKATYFKELGDPRTIDPQTGEVNDSLSIEEEATSLWYDRYYTPGSPYGTPQWSACIPAMLGSREAESVNLSFFRDNAIPAMAVLVSGGALTAESFDKIESYFTQAKGADAQNRIVVIEASSDVTEVAGIDGSIAAPKIDIKPMLSDRQHEGLFSKYIEAGGNKIRQAMRLPPIYIGSAEEYNRASAFASIQTAEQQVFIPERLSWDFFMEHIVMAGYNLRYWKVQSVQPSYNDPQEVTSLLTALGKEGALTPNVCIQLSNRFLNTEIESVREEWGDMPFAATLAAVNRGGADVKGFGYIVAALKNAALTPTNGTDDTDQDEVTITKNAVSVLLDDLSENLSRQLQTVDHE